MTTITRPRTNARAQRRASRRGRVQHLVTADEQSLLELEMFLTTLPLCTVGRVFIEVPDAASIIPVQAPPRMTVTWLPRDTRAGAIGSGRRCGRGEALSRAAVAWAGEMFCPEQCTDAPADETRVTLLGGYLGTAEIVEQLTERFDVPTAHISAPERFGLLPQA